MNSTSLYGLRILVVEDEPIIALDVARLLAAAGATVVGPAHTVAHALRLIERSSVDVAVLDYQLETETASLVVHRLRSMEIPFLFHSSSRGRVEGRRKITLADLEHEPWVMFPKDSLIASYFAKASHAIMPIHESVTSFSMHVRMQLLATGRFLTILHSSTLRYYAKPWALKALPIDLAIPPIPVAVFTLRNRALSPVVR